MMKIHKNDPKYKNLIMSKTDLIHQLKMSKSSRTTKHKIPFFRNS